MLVVGNWKLNTDCKSAIRLASEVARMTEADTRSVSVGVCPPYVWLDAVRERLRGSRVALGAQNVYTQDSGAFTGEVSAPMLAELDCAYVIVGHSERRQYFRESDAFVGEKLKHVSAHGMTPILCVGETLEERKSDQAESVVLRQLDGGVAGFRMTNEQRLIVAYEPVWAIGTGETATPEQAQEMHTVIRAHLTSLLGDQGRKAPILYGGSVKPKNANELFSQPDIDGGLIGGASLDAGSFVSIVHTAASLSQK